MAPRALSVQRVPLAPQAQQEQRALARRVRRALQVPQEQTGPLAQQGPLAPQAQQVRMARKAP